MLSTDQHLRRKPELFRVFYPSDDLECWISAANAAIPNHALDRHKEAETQRWIGPYMEYEKPEYGAHYVIGADPCGHAARDHASFQVLKCYEGEWTQVACYAEHSDPLEFTQKLVEAGMRFNRANIVVESNGVGQGVISLLRDWNYPNIFFEKHKKPGFTSTSKSVDEALGWLIDGLLDELVLRDKNTIEQLMSYKNDKRIEEGANSELVRGQPNRKRRDRHHWDKVSALIMAIVGARWAPSRRRPFTSPEENVIEFRPMTYDERVQHHKDLHKKKKKSRSKYWL